MDDPIQLTPLTHTDAQPEGLWPLLMAVAVVLAFMGSASLLLDYCLACL